MSQNRASLDTSFDPSDLQPLRVKAWRKRLTVGAAATLAVGFGMGASIPMAHADDDLSAERSVSQFLVIENERAALDDGLAKPLTHPGLPRPGEPEPPEEVNSSHNVAILPQVGYDPAVGFILGGQYSDINFGPSHLNLSVGATQSTGGETAFDGTLGTPELFGSKFIGLVRAHYQLRPTQDFYGLGNNDVGQNPISEHELHIASLTFTLAHPLAYGLMVAGSIGYNRTTIGHGHPENHDPATTDAFSDLPGIEGGYINPISLSLIYDTHRDLTRPSQGVNAILKVQNVGPELGNDFNYTTVIGDASYILPLGSDKHLLGFRVDGEYNSGDNNDLPFFSFASLGGFDNLEGFQPDRFLGQSRVFARAAYQQLLADFDFRNIWRVRLDGTVFTGAGRVFLDKSRLPADLLADEPDVAPGLSDRIQVSYGAGLDIALGEAIATRLDVGFSHESQGLIYLSFGNAF